LAEGLRGVAKYRDTANLETAGSRRPPDWLEWNDTEKAGKVTQLPSREQIDTPVDEQLIVEYYSR